MTSNKAVTATFTQNQYTLTVTTVGSGSVSKSPSQATYTWGTIVTLTAIPSTGWSFSSWSGDASGTSLSTTVNMTSNKAVTATFTQIPVGGYAAPIATGKEVSPLLAPQIGLAFALLAAMAATILLTKRRSKTLK
jgi:uncharacterized repeat protein (TIGR02543 family)